MFRFWVFQFKVVTVKKFILVSYLFTNYFDSSRNSSSGGSPNTTGSTLASNLDPNSKPFAPRPSSYPGSYSEVGLGGDRFCEVENLRDEAFIEKDSNANGENLTISKVVKTKFNGDLNTELVLYLNS